MSFLDRIEQRFLTEEITSGNKRLNQVIKLLNEDESDEAKQYLEDELSSSDYENILTDYERDDLIYDLEDAEGSFEPAGDLMPEAEGLVINAINYLRRNPDDEVFEKLQSFLEKNFNTEEYQESDDRTKGTKIVGLYNALIDATDKEEYKLDLRSAEAEPEVTPDEEEPEVTPDEEEPEPTPDEEEPEAEEEAEELEAEEEPEPTPDEEERNAQIAMQQRDVADVELVEKRGDVGIFKIKGRTRDGNVSYRYFTITGDRLLGITGSDEVTEKNVHDYIHKLDKEYKNQIKKAENDGNQELVDEIRKKHHARYTAIPKAAYQNFQRHVSRQEKPKKISDFLEQFVGETPKIGLIKSLKRLGGISDLKFKMAMLLDDNVIEDELEKIREEKKGSLFNKQAVFRYFSNLKKRYTATESYEKYDEILTEALRDTFERFVTKLTHNMTPEDLKRVKRGLLYDVLARRIKKEKPIQLLELLKNHGIKIPMEIIKQIEKSDESDRELIPNPDTNEKTRLDAVDIFKRDKKLVSNLLNVSNFSSAYLEILGKAKEDPKLQNLNLEDLVTFINRVNDAVQHNNLASLLRSYDQTSLWTNINNLNRIYQSADVEEIYGLKKAQQKSDEFAKSNKKKKIGLSKSDVDALKHKHRERKKNKNKKGKENWEILTQPLGTEDESYDESLNKYVDILAEDPTIEYARLTANEDIKSALKIYVDQCNRLKRSSLTKMLTEDAQKEFDRLLNKSKEAYKYYSNQLGLISEDTNNLFSNMFNIYMNTLDPIKHKDTIISYHKNPKRAERIFLNRKIKTKEQGEYVPISNII